MPHKKTSLNPMQKVFHLQSREFRLLFLYSGRHCVELWLEFGRVAKLKKTNLLFLNTKQFVLRPFGFLPEECLCKFGSWVVERASPLFPSQSQSSVRPPWNEKLLLVFDKQNKGKTNRNKWIRPSDLEATMGIATFFVRFLLSWKRLCFSFL